MISSTRMVLLVFLKAVDTYKLSNVDFGLQQLVQTSIYGGMLGLKLINLSHLTTSIAFLFG